MKWMFTTEKARAKMGRAYPKPTAKLNQPAIVADPTRCVLSCPSDRTR